MSEFDNVINEINKKNEAKETVEQTVEDEAMSDIFNELFYNA